MSVKTLFRQCPDSGLYFHRSAESLMKAHAVLGVVFLLIGGFFGLLVAATRTPAIHLLDAESFYQVLTFHGGIGVQSVLPNGSPDEVKDMVRRTIDVMGEGGGYLCSSSHNLRPEIPWLNILAFVEAVREYGHP